MERDRRLWLCWSNSTECRACKAGVRKRKILLPRWVNQSSSLSLLRRNYVDTKCDVSLAKTSLSGLQATLCNRRHQKQHLHLMYSMTRTSSFITQQRRKYQTTCLQYQIVIANDLPWDFLATFLLQTLFSVQEGFMIYPPVDVLVTFCVNRLYTTQNVLWSRASVCLCVCVSVSLSECLSAAVRPHCCTDPDVTWGRGRGCPLVVHYWADLQSRHGLGCYGNITRTLVTSLRPSRGMTT